MPLPAKGRLPDIKVKVGTPRPLTRDDLRLLPERRATPSSTPSKLRESHHNVARLVATGLRDRVISEQTGYTPTRIGQLRASPAFQQLVSTYKTMIDGEFVEEADAYFKTAFGNMVAAERHIADHLADADEMGELIPIKTALAISRDAADRFGYGKRQMNVNVNVDFAAKLEDAIRRSGKLIDVAPGSAPTITSPSAPAQGSSSRPLEDPAPSFRRRA